jgi:hypothetical protein
MQMTGFRVPEKWQAVLPVIDLQLPCGGKVLPFTFLSTFNKQLFN